MPFAMEMEDSGSNSSSIAASLKTSSVVNLNPIPFPGRKHSTPLSVVPTRISTPECPNRPPYNPKIPKTKPTASFKQIRDKVQKNASNDESCHIYRSVECHRQSPIPIHPCSVPKGLNTPTIKSISKRAPCVQKSVCMSVIEHVKIPPNKNHIQNTLINASHGTESWLRSPRLDGRFTSLM